MRRMMLLLPVLCLLIGCGSEDTADGFLPIAVGNIWTYDMAYRMIVIDTTEYLGTSTTEITSETVTNNNVEVFEQVTTMVWDDTMMTNSVDTTYIQVTDDYVLIYNDLADIAPDTSLVLPIEQGNTWTVYADAADTMTAEVIEQADVTVPAGSYEDCWDIQYTSLGQTQDNWFADGVGIVRHRMTMINQAFISEFTKELTDVDLQ